MAGSPTPAKSRDLRIDAARGLAIVLVVVRHACARHDATYPDGLLPTAIVSFHIQLFALLSGYVLYGRIRSPRAQWLGKKLLSLMVPFAAWTLVFFWARHLAFTGLTATLGSSDGFGEFVVKVIHSPWASLGYLWFLAQASIIIVLALPLFEDRPGWRRGWNVARDVAVVVILAKLTSHITNPYYGWNHLLGNLPAFLIGYLVAKYRPQLRPYKWHAIAASAVIYPVVFGTNYYHWGGVPGAINALLMNAGKIVFLLRPNALTQMTGIVLATALVVAGMRLPPFKKTFVCIGQRSLGIYAAHMMFLNVGFGEWHLRVLTVTIFATALAGVVTHLLSSWRPLQFLFLGGALRSARGNARTLRAEPVATAVVDMRVHAEGAAVRAGDTGRD